MPVGTMERTFVSQPQWDSSVYWSTEPSLYGPGQRRREDGQTRKGMHLIYICRPDGGQRNLKKTGPFKYQNTWEKRGLLCWVIQPFQGAFCARSSSKQSQAPWPRNTIQIRSRESPAAKGVFISPSSESYPDMVNCILKCRVLQHRRLSSHYQ